MTMIIKWKKDEKQSDSVIIENISWHWPGGTKVNRKTLNESSRWPTGDSISHLENTSQRFHY
jgi:hypothetical protein